MALSYTKKTWTDTASSGTALSAGDLNKFESALNNLTSTTNTLSAHHEVKSSTGITFLSDISSGRSLDNRSTRIGNFVNIDFYCTLKSFSAMEVWKLGTAPIPAGNKYACSAGILQADYPYPILCEVTSSGEMHAVNKSSHSFSSSSNMFLFFTLKYICR